MKRVLIVEDQRLIAADIESTLTKIGYDVAGSVASGEEAVAAAAAAGPDLVLMDIRLRGDMDGIAAAEAIRARTDTTVVYLTAYADEETILRAKTSAPFGYIVKPFNERELRAAIEVALYRHETERLLAEERQRRRAAEEFKLLVEGVREYAIFVVDGAGRVSTWNAGAERLKGYRRDEVIGRPIAIFFTEEDRASGRPAEALERAAAEGSHAEEGWRVRRDGTRFWASVVTTALKDGEGRVVGFAKVTRDMTEEKLAEERLRGLNGQLEKAVDARDEFLSIASHELRTPLSALVLQLQGLERALADADARGGDGKVARKLDKALRTTDRLARLVDSLLDVSRIATGRLEISREDVDLADLVRVVAERFGEAARRAGCTIRVGAPEAVPGRWDALRVEQALANLLSNALKYGPGGPIDVILESDAERARLSVRDRGIGIPPEDLHRIFGRFERAAPARHYGGLGLGLYIARTIVEAHGGRIAVESAPGAGATFTLELPHEPLAHENAAGAPAGAQP